ncbi:MAG: NUDIX domain-containing protein [Burkholderiales bacterium]
MPKPKMLYPLVVVDIALFCVDDNGLNVLLVKRSNEPAQGFWSLPGGVLQPERDRDLESAARRVLREKIGVDVRYLSEVRSFSGPDRDPRGWSIGMLFFALLPRDHIHAIVKDSVDQVEWVSVRRITRAMAFDHSEQIDAAVQVLRDKVERHVPPLHLMPAEFTLGSLQKTCEAILGRPLDKSVFRRRLKGSPDLIALHVENTGSAQRPSLLYRASDGFQF